MVFRFLGTTPASSSIRRTLESICQQILFLYSDGQSFEIPDSFSELQKQFVHLLSLASSDKPLVLILDSLDQLSGEDYAHKLGWLPKILPPFTHMIISTLPTEHGILETLRLKVEAENFIEVPVLGEELSFQILLSWLRSRDRTLSDSQVEIVQQAFHYCGLPLYVKLVFEEVMHWKSFTLPDQTVLAHTIREVINDLFLRLNKKHGQVFVMHTLGYLTASQNGLGEDELEDILSLDDEVLADVFQYHVPPIRRIPPILWVRLKNDILSYLAVREVDSYQVIYWYHRQFIEAATHFYLEDKRSTRDLHSLLADYWLNTWHNRKKPFTYTKYQMKKLKLSSPESSEDRLVPDQPLIFKSDNQERFNYRKLNHLPYHLYHAGRAEELKSVCLFNYRWLLTKIRATSVREVLMDLDLFSEEDVEVRMLRNVLNLASSTLRLSPETLGVEIIGRLLPFATPQHSHVRSLVDQTYEQCYQDNVLIPKQQCFKAPGGSLKFTMESVHTPLTEKILELSEDCSRLYMVTDDNHVLVWDLIHGEVMREIELSSNSEPKFNVGSLTSGSQYLICACAFHKETNPVVLVSIIEEEVHSCLNLEKAYASIGFKESYKVTLACNKILAVVINKCSDCYDMKTGKLLHTFDVAPSSFNIIPAQTHVLFHVKNSNQILLCSLENYETMDSISLGTSPVCWIVDAESENVIFGLVNSLELEVHQLLHRIGGKLERGKVSKHSIRRAVKGDAAILNFTLSANGKFLLVNTSVNFVLWDLKKSQTVRSFAIPDSLKPRHRIQQANFFGKMSADGSFIIGAYDEHLIIWDCAKGSVQRIIRASLTLKLSTLLLSKDSSIAITTAERSRIIKVWDLMNIEEDVFTPLSLKSSCRYVSLDSHGHLAAVRSYDPTETRVLDMDAGTIISEPEHTVESMQPYLTSDGQYLILRKYMGAESVLSVWNSVSGQLVGEIPVSSLVFKNYAISSNNKWIVTHQENSPTQDVEVKLWSLNNAVSEEGKFPIVEGGFAYIYFALHDRYIVFLKQYPQVNEGRECTILIYDLESKDKVKEVQNILKDSLYVINNGTILLAVQTQSSTDNCNLLIFNLEKLAIERQIGCNGAPPVGRMSFNAKETRAIDVALRVFCLSTGKILAQFPDEMHNIIQKSMQTWPKMSACGNYVAWTVVEKAVVNIGHVETGQWVGQCFVHANPLALQISSKNVVLIGADDGRIMLLHLIDKYHGDPKKSIDVIRQQKENEIQAAKPGNHQPIQGKESSICILL